MDFEPLDTSLDLQFRHWRSLHRDHWHGDHCMAPRSLIRVAAWLVLAAIVVLSLVPATARPTTMAPHAFEHAGIFLLDGMAFGIAYHGHERWAVIGAVAFCAVVELAQLLVPGRHARVSDFVVDAVAACIGILAGPPLIRMTGRHT